MFPRWFLSTFITDATGAMIPVCAAYGAMWHCPTFPTDASGQALVQMYVNIGGLAAAAQDSRVIICPDVTNTANVASAVVSAYATPAAGATGSGPAKTQSNLMVLNGSNSYTMSGVVTALAAVEPAFLHVMIA